MATSNKTPVVIPQPIAAQATSQNINAIPNGATGTNRASFQEGFPAITRMPVIENPLPTQVSGLPPKQQDFNGLFNVVSQHNFFAQNGGTYSFNQAVSDAIGGYPKNALLWYFPENENPCLVRSLINDNTNNFVDDPTLIDGIHWEMLVNPSSYANLALTNSPYTTNRILEIPQNIKLELNNGTLTLKAGSKVYVPNGFEVDGVTPKFNVVTIDSDKTRNDKSSTTNTPLFYIQEENRIVLYQGFSGSTAPTFIGQGIWYDTTNNVCKRSKNGGSTWDTVHASLPCALVTNDGTEYKSIDQVFNGFGYIGSTVFALPGVKVQASNGKNKDGTYNSSVYTTSTVFTMPIDAGWGTFDVILTQSYLNKWPNVINGSVGTRYNSENNYYEVYSAGQSKWVPLPMQLAVVKLKADTTSPYKITSFEPYTVDSVVNSNEFYQLKDKAVTTDTNQTISGVKTFSNGTLKALRPILLKQNNADAGGQIDFERSNNSVLKNNPFIDLFVNAIRFIGVNSDNTVNITLQVDLENKQVLVPTPATTANDTQAATTAWVNSKMQVVSALPANPNPNVFYFIPG